MAERLVSLPKVRSAQIRAATRALLVAMGAGVLAAAGARHAGANPLSPWLSHPYVHGWARWDSHWYAQIARFGYWYRPGEQSPVAFFPGYPFLLGLWNRAGIDVYVSGIALTLVCGVAAAVLFARWAERLRSAADADVAGWLLLLYPFSLYLYGAVYSDALFLALVLGAFWCLEKGRSGWAAVLGALATATRPLAPAVVLGLTVRQIERARLEGRPLRFRDAVPLLASVGFLAYCAFLYAKFGDPLAFAHVQGAPGWDQAPGWHSWLKVTWFERVLDPATSLRGQARLWIHALTACGALALVIPTGRRLGWGYAVYCAVAVGIPFVSSKDFMGMGRYVLSSFPLFLTGASVLEGRPRLRVTWLVVSGTGLAGLAYAFGADVYVS